MLFLWGLKNVEMSIKNLATLCQKKKENAFDRTAFFSANFFAGNDVLNYS